MLRGPVLRTGIDGKFFPAFAGDDISARMRNLIFSTISLFGRYAVLLLIPPLALAVWGWSLLLDDYFWLPIVLVLPLVLCVTAVLTLCLGMLISGSPRHSGVTMNADEAPDLWAYWEKASPRKPGMRRQIIVDDRINAAMGERSLFAGLFGRDQTLVVGLGMLVILDRPAVEAVLEHEFAHAELKHSHGLTRLNEFTGTYERFEGTLEYELPWVAIVLELGFNALNDWLRSEFLRRSKQYEFEADRQSADRVGPHTEARSQMLAEGGGHLAEKMIYEPLEKELRGALRAPRPPLARMIDMRETLVEPGNVRRAVDEVLAEDPDPDSTHPPLKERLASVGADPGMAIAPAGPPALESMLPEATRLRLIAEFDRNWVSMVDEYVGIQ
jgi:Zn-dependent protease with chaperone function